MESSTSIGIGTEVSLTINYNPKLKRKVKNKFESSTAKVNAKYLNVIISFGIIFYTTTCFCSVGCFSITGLYLKRNRLMKNNKLTEMKSPLLSLPFAPRAGKNIDENEIEISLSYKVIESLDLHPLLIAISQHCTTRRGRNALLGIVNDNSAARVDVSYADQTSLSNRQKILYQYTEKSSYQKESNWGIPESTGTRSHNNKKHKGYPIVKMSNTAEECQNEYIRISEAMSILKESLRIRSNGNGSNVFASVLPPIYGASSSPWDTQNLATTDHDEWLGSDIGGSIDCSMERGLEVIAQAEQIIKMIILTQKWANDEFTKKQAPALSMCIDEALTKVNLEDLYEDLRDAVVIKRELSISNVKTFSFHLNEEKYPQIRVLRQKEKVLTGILDSYVKKYLRGMQDKTNGKGTLEAIELDGRIVIPVPRDKVASGIGLVRGLSKKGSICYVEPIEVVEKSDELIEIRNDLLTLEKTIQQQLIASLHKASPYLDEALDCIASLDTVFARAAFGCTTDGQIPIVGTQGCINVASFQHPILILEQQKTTETSSMVVPIDLRLGVNYNFVSIEGDKNDQQHKSLIISGPNGGGKTLALKSFGLAAIMVKLGIPIPACKSNIFNGSNCRVDYFANIFIEIGDKQNIMSGESTLLSKLNGYSDIIQRIQISDTDYDNKSKALMKDTDFSLILLDELGGGTDPVAGGALGRAILEEMVSCRDGDRTRTVLTTHLLSLKALPLDDDRFGSASVELGGSQEAGRLPTYVLSYGCIGDSSAINAATRCQPVLPERVLQRARDLMNAETAAVSKGMTVDDMSNVFKNITESLNGERKYIEKIKRGAELFYKDANWVRDGTVALARAFETHYTRLENRLESIFDVLRKNETKTAYDIIGETLIETKLRKRRVQQSEDFLIEKGLRKIPPTYNFRFGETVVIVKSDCEWDGMTASVIAVDSRPLSQAAKSSINVNYLQHSSWKEITVVPSINWEGNCFESNDDSTLNSTRPLQKTLTLTDADVGIWDYPSMDDYGNYFLEYERTSNVKFSDKSVSESRNRLNEIFNKLEMDSERQDTQNFSTRKADKLSKNKPFISARERKAAKALRKSEAKRKNKKNN